MKYGSGRAKALHEITGLMGDALKALEAENIKLDDRSIRLFTDRFIELYKQLPDDPQLTRFSAFLELISTDEIHHGGLLRTETLRERDNLRRELRQRG